VGRNGFCLQVYPQAMLRQVVTDCQRIPEWGLDAGRAICCLLAFWCRWKVRTACFSAHQRIIASRMLQLNKMCASRASART